MNDSISLGLYNLIDWKELITDLSKKKGSDIIVDFNNWNLETPGYQEIYNIWQAANFNTNAIKWINYYPGIDFSTEIIDNISNYLDISVHRSWISRIDPGFFAPWHWDVDDNEGHYKEKGEIIRYSCFISPCSLGHIFIIGKDYFYNQEEGTLIKWKKYNEWHAGMNGGLKSKYMLHIIGYQNSF